MKHTPKILTLFGALLISSSVWAVDASYYTSLDGKSGEELFNAAKTVVNKNFNQLEYKEIWNAFLTTDLYPSGHAMAGKIWDMYSNCNFTPIDDQDKGSGSSECTVYNREHSIPKNWFGGTEAAIGADLLHIVPTDKIVNNQRSNYAFGEVATASYTYANSKLGSSKNITITNTVLGASFTTTSKPSIVFEPADEYKGDFARGYFATMTKWAGSYSITTSDGVWFFNNTYTEIGKFGLADYGLALLMKWHRQDPVSQKEIDRNNGIQAVQGNRNPFVDYPCLAEYIWGNKVGEAFNTANCCGSFESGFAGDGCTACGSTTPPTDPSISVNPASVTITTAPGSSKTATITVTGSNLTADIAINVSGEGFSTDKTSLGTTGGTVTITFAPTAEGTINGTLTLTSGSATKTVALTGNGMASNAITPPQPAPAAGPFLMVGDPIIVENVKQTDITCTGTTTLQLNIANLVQNATISSSNTSVFTVSPTSVSPAEAAAGVQVTITKVTNGSGTLTIIAGPVTRTVTVSCQ